MKSSWRLWISFAITLWLLFSAGCMQFRQSTQKAVKGFSKEGMVLHGVQIPWSGGDINAVWTGDTSKPWLCFLHGSPGGWPAFEDYLKDSALRENFCMIAIDRPGFGYSSFGKPESSLEKQSQAVMLVLDSILGSDQFLLAGHSLGGPLGIKMAILYPDRVVGAFVLAGSVDPDLEPREFFRPLLKKKVFRYLMPKSFWVSNYEIEGLMAELQVMSGQWNQVKCPVVSIHGTKDEFVPVENADFMKNKLDGVTPYRDIRLEGQSHFIPWNSMDTIRKEIINFVAHE